jgi:hypothetical protein
MMLVIRRWPTSTCCHYTDAGIEDMAAIPQFKQMLDIADPKRGDTLQLPPMADFTTAPVEAKPRVEAGNLA